MLFIHINVHDNKLQIYEFDRNDDDFDARLEKLHPGMVRVIKNICGDPYPHGKLNKLVNCRLRANPNGNVNGRRLRSILQRMTQEDGGFKSKTISSVNNKIHIYFIFTISESASFLYHNELLDSPKPKT